jgi:hypothetical protein
MSTSYRGAQAHVAEQGGSVPGQNAFLYFFLPFFRPQPCGATSARRATSWPRWQGRLVTDDDRAGATGA